MRGNIEQICEDIFHLEGDRVMHVTAIKREINKTHRSAPVNVRPYWLLKNHKKEMNQQIRKMLHDHIISPSSSQ